MTNIESWQNPEQKTFAFSDFRLSQSVQDFFQPITKSNVSENVSLVLDFGTAAELYQSSAYKGGRLSARVFMADEIEQKIDATRIQRPSDAAGREGQFTDKDKQNTWTDATEVNRTTQKYSAAIEDSRDARITEIKAAGGFQKFEITGLDIETDRDREQLAIRDDYLNRSEFRKPEPRDGDNLSLKQILDDYKTSFIDAYEHSKKLKEGEPCKSKTLEEIVDRLKACPWADKIRVRFDSEANNPDYNNFESTITIKPQDPAWKQIDTFAHEGYHATHQTLNELYLGNNPAPLPEFLRVKGDAEVGSFETEVKVHTELGSLE